MVNVVKKASSRTTQLLHAKEPVKALGGKSSPLKFPGVKITDFSKMTPAGLGGKGSLLASPNFMKPPKVKF